jgi:hypothetical protein
MKITPISMISLCILFLVVAMVLFWNVPSRDRRFPPRVHQTIHSQVSLATTVGCRSERREIVLYSRAEKRLALTVVYDMYLRISAIRKDNDGNTIVKVWNHTTCYHQCTYISQVPAFVRAHRGRNYGADGVEGCQTYQYLQRCHRYGKAWGLKTLIPPSDLILHDACKAVSQNVFTTTEIAKFKMSRDAPYDILYVILIS